MSSFVLEYLKKVLAVAKQPIGLFVMDDDYPNNLMALLIKSNTTHDYWISNLSTSLHSTGGGARRLEIAVETCKNFNVPFSFYIITKQELDNLVHERIPLNSIEKSTSLFPFMLLTNKQIDSMQQRAYELLT